MTVSRERREQIIAALRRGTVPESSLDVLAVGLDRFDAALDDELAAATRGTGGFKAVRGEYGSGKTFFGRWLQERAKKRGFATAEVQISETETPLHRLETVYRRMNERLSTADAPHGALRSIVDGWFYTLEQDVVSSIKERQDHAAVAARTAALMEQRLTDVTRTTPALAAALRAYHHALQEGDTPTADGLIAWVAGQPNVAASVKRAAAIKGDIDHFGALSFLRGLLVILKDSGYAGLMVVLDEVETLQRVRSDIREKSLNALRQLLDEIDGGRFPGLYLVITGTSPFFDGPQGVQRLPPLAQRLHVDFTTDARFDNPRAVQIRLPAFTSERLQEVGSKVRDLFAVGSSAEGRIRSMVDDRYVAGLATAVSGRFGGKVGVVPRIFLKKLVADVLDRVDQFPEFDPRTHYALTVSETELTPVERAASAGTSLDDIQLEDV
jgi:hypothetical protein